MKKIVIGILAHVDAGKTTLSESILYLCGAIRKLGRVDNRDAFLDTHQLERARGITIFSKQARLRMGDYEVTLMDTPGHEDFSADMERTLQILDYAVLVISGADGVQAHTYTLWKLLARYKTPVFLFINKMDQEGTDKELLLRELKERLDENCLDFTSGEMDEKLLDELALCDGALLDEFLGTGSIKADTVSKAVAARKVFPCCFGSALRLTGVEEFLDVMKRYMQARQYSEEFGARVYKVGRDEQGVRLTYMKITGGRLLVKDLIRSGTGEWEEKADQIRIYTGPKYETVNEAQAGDVCAVTGLRNTKPGEGLGIESAAEAPLLMPVLTYQIFLPPACDIHSALLKLRQLEEEEPLLHIVWKERLEELQIQVMGEVQTEILKSIILERFGMEVTFGAGNIVYKETIASAVIGMGHFEPLRHYAEVHLLLEPGEPGSGLEFCSKCSEDMLERNWQHLILSHLQEREHPGVLSGYPLTDMRITLIAGKAHVKHTESGDFRQAAYRALRQGLRQAENILLEPYYSFRLEVPSEMVGRAMSDIQKMDGSFGQPVLKGEFSVLSGSAPVAQMLNYQTQVNSYSKGKGRLTCMVKGYEPCRKAEEVIKTIGYDADRDIENPSDSIFCAHGAGYAVAWQEAGKRMHVSSGFVLEKEETESVETRNIPSAAANKKDTDAYREDKELEAIFERTYGKGKQAAPPGYRLRKKIDSSIDSTVYKKYTKPRYQGEYLLVDGYNIIFAWEELRDLAKVSLDGARNKLMDILCNYQGFVQCTLILVFDAYKVKGNPGEISKYHGIYVVYTKEAETADQYIEKTVHEMGGKYHVTVATSDALEQMIILGQGARRMSANGLLEEIERINKVLREDYLG